MLRRRQRPIPQAPALRWRAVRHTSGGWVTQPERWDVVNTNTDVMSTQPFASQQLAEQWIRSQGAQVLDAWSGRS